MHCIVLGVIVIQDQDEEMKNALILIACACAMLFATTLLLYFAFAPADKHTTKSKPAEYNYAAIAISAKELDDVVQQVQEDMRKKTTPNATDLERKLNGFKQDAASARPHGVDMPKNVQTVIIKGTEAVTALRRHDIILAQQALMVTNDMLGEVLFTINHYVQQNQQLQ